MSNIKFIEAALEAGSFTAEQAAAAAQEVQARMAVKQINPAIPANVKFGAIHCTILEILHNLRWHGDRNFFMIADAIGVKFEGEAPFDAPVFIKPAVIAEPGKEIAPLASDNEEWDEQDDDYIDD